MKPILTLQELAISLTTAKWQNSTPLTLAYLKERCIIPEDWIISRPPVHTEQVTQIAFTNGVSLISRPDSITFLEPLKSSEEIRVATIAHDYSKSLPEADYQEVVIDIRSFVTFEDSDDRTAYEYIKTLLSSGDWLESNQEPVRVNINLTYTLDQRQLILSISEVRLQLLVNQMIPSVLFSGRFSYKIKGTTASERLQNLAQVIGYWERDLESYREIVNKGFLRAYL